MKSFGKRRIILISLVAVFLCIYILQLVLGNGAGIKKAGVKGNVVSINIEGKETAILLSKDGEDWFVGSDKLPAVSYYSQRCADLLEDLELIGTAANSAEGNLSRFGLDEDTCLYVSYETDAGESRSLILGKDTSTGGQSYVLVDSKDKVYITSESLRYWFGKDISEFIETEEDTGFDSAEIFDVSDASLEI